MTAKETAQWVIDNRYPKNEHQKVSDAEMYHELVDRINKSIRHIAKQAVQVEIEYSGDQPFGGSHARSVSKRILTRINELTQGDRYEI